MHRNIEIKIKTKIRQTYEFKYKRFDPNRDFCVKVNFKKFPFNALPHIMSCFFMHINIFKEGKILLGTKV